MSVERHSGLPLEKIEEKDKNKEYDSELKKRFS